MSDEKADCLKELERFVRFGCRSYGEELRFSRLKHEHTADYLAIVKEISPERYAKECVTVRLDRIIRAGKGREYIANLPAKAGWGALPYILQEM